MKHWIAIFGAALATAAARADDANWTASVPLWKSLSPTGQLVDAGPAPAWMSPPPPARIGRAPELPRPAPIGTPRPHELPEKLIGEQGPSLAPFAGVVSAPAGDRPGIFTRESFARDPSPPFSSIPARSEPTQIPRRFNSRVSPAATLAAPRP